MLKGVDNNAGAFITDFVKDAHGVGFACSCLAIDEESPIEAVNDVID